MVEHEVVAIGIREERHVADAGVEDLARELDAVGLELGTRRGHVVDIQGRVGVLRGANSMPKRAGSQMPKQVSPAQTSKRALSSARSPRVST